MRKSHDLSAAERLDAIAQILATGIHRWLLQRAPASAAPPHAFSDRTAAPPEPMQ